MYIKTLKLNDFRNHHQFAGDFDNQVVVFIGPNTVGKTNLIEAIRFLSIFKSFRSSSTKDLIRWGQKHARVEAEVESDKITKKIASVLSNNGENFPTKREIKLEGSKTTTRKAVGSVLTVLFSPEDIQLITSSPSKRRRYLDTVLGQVSRRYYESLLSYNHSLEQRNAILSDPTQANLTQLNTWDDQLSYEGGRLIKERSTFLEEVNNLIPETYKYLAEKGQLIISYQPRLSQPGMEKLLSREKLSDLLLQSLKQSREIDLRYKTTSTGPHRDDFSFLLNDKPIANYGSRGEWRSAVLSLKIAEKDYIKKRVKSDPILLLDDVFSELDNRRRAALGDRISDNQTFISTTDVDSLGSNLSDVANILTLKNDG